MTTDQAKQWVEWFYALEDDDSVEANEEYDAHCGDLFDTVIHVLYDCFDMPSQALREKRGVETYHDIWLDVISGDILDCDNRLGYARELDALYAVYVKDQFARHAMAPDKEGFHRWLAVWLAQNDLERVMQHWPPQPRR